MKICLSLCFAVPTAALAVVSVLSAPARADFVKISAVSTCSPSEPGHAAIAFYAADGNPAGTYAVWKNTPPVRYGTAFDIKLMYQNKIDGCGKIVSRVAYVTTARRKELMQFAAYGTGCTRYLLVGGEKVGSRLNRPGSCSCVDYATRVWSEATGGKENWKGLTIPTFLYDTIRIANAFTPKAKPPRL